MSIQDIRWQQRFSNYVKAFMKLEEAVRTIQKDYQISEDGTINADDFLDDIIKEGLIQRFEYTHELAWKVMKDFLAEAGNTNVFGSKDSTREAFAAGLITHGDVWKDMIASRNKTSHTYNEDTADEIFLKVIHHYHKQFSAFKDRMEELQSGQQTRLL